MKWFLFCYGILTFSLLGCQYTSPIHVVKVQSNPEPEVKGFERTVKYGMKFASEYSAAPGDTCLKYKKLYQKGDWRAGWVLALHVRKPNTRSCLGNKEAMLILTTLESEKKINSELIWFTQYHLRLLQQLHRAARKIRKLEKVVDSNKQQATDLKKQNQEQLEKLDALKEIETSIINE